MGAGEAGAGLSGRGAKWERTKQEKLGWSAQEAQSRECRDGVGQRVAEHVRLGAPAKCA